MAKRPGRVPKLSKDTSEVIGDLVDQAALVAGLLDHEGFSEEAQAVRRLGEECAATRARLERAAGAAADRRPPRHDMT